MANAGFAAYARARMNGSTITPHPYLQQPLGSTVSNGSSLYYQPGNTYFNLVAPAAHPHHPVNHYQHVTLCNNNMADGQAFFKNFVKNPDAVYLPSNFEPLPPSTQHPSFALSSFRPLASYQHTPEANAPHGQWQPDNRTSLPLLNTALHVPHTYPNTTSARAIKVDNSPSIPTPTVLPGPVDVSKYDPVSYDDWAQATTEYESASPESGVSEDSDSPATPRDRVYNSDGTWSFNPHRPGGPCPSNSSFSSQSSVYGPVGGPTLPFVFYNPLPAVYPGHRTANLYPYRPRAAPAPMHNSVSPLELELQPTHHQLDQEDGSCSEADGSEGEETPASGAASMHEDDVEDDQASEHEDDSEEDDNEDEDEKKNPRNRDALLVRMRRSGMPYAEIKRRYAFTEAESTLRGRYRALTKAKDDRVRRPEWLANDIDLLRRAVRHYSQHVDIDAQTRAKRANARLPWKKISEWMRGHGSSYLFAPATCAKKWLSCK